MNQVSVRQDLSLGQLSKALVASGFFNDTRQVEQAVVKVMAGMELGFGPISSMTGIHIIKGKVTLSANFMAAKVKSNPKYDYRVEYQTNKGCKIIFYQYEPDGTKELLGHYEFTEEDRKAANLNGDNWKKHPKAMYFARAISQGIRSHCPDIFHGSPTYTPDELGETADEDVQIVEAQAVEVVEKAVQEVKEEPEQEPEQEVVEETVDPNEGDVEEEPASPEKKKPDLKQAFWNYLNECKKHKLRISERRYRGVLKRYGMKKSNEIPYDDRMTAKGLTTMQRILVDLRSVTDIHSDEGFDEEIEHLGSILHQEGFKRFLSQIEEEHLNEGQLKEGKSLDSSTIPDAQRIGVINKINKIIDDYVPKDQ